MSTQLAKIEEQINAPAIQSQFFEYLGAEDRVKLSQEINFVKQAVSKSSYLAKATPESFAEALVNVALSGLSLNPQFQQAHLVPRKVGGVIKACLDPDYKGLISVAYKFKIAYAISADVVYENDEFEFDYLENKIKKWQPYHSLGNDKPGKEVGAIARSEDFDGKFRYAFIPIKRINEIMETSQSYKSNKASSLWTGVHRPEMIKKTAIKQLWKLMPKVSPEAEKFAQAVDMSNADFDDIQQPQARKSPFNVKQETEDAQVIDVTPEPTKEKAITKSGILKDLVTMGATQKEILEFCGVDDGKGITKEQVEVLREISITMVNNSSTFNVAKELYL